MALKPYCARYACELDKEHPLREAVRAFVSSGYPFQRFFFSKRDGCDLGIRADRATVTNFSTTARRALLHQLDTHDGVVVETSRPDASGLPRSPQRERSAWMTTPGRASARTDLTPSSVRRSYAALRGTKMSLTPLRWSSATIREPRKPAPAGHEIRHCTERPRRRVQYAVE